jgi:hypothetical protein
MCLFLPSSLAVLEFNQKLQKIDLFRFEYSIVFQIFPEKSETSGSQPEWAHFLSNFFVDYLREKQNIIAENISLLGLEID